MIQHLNNRVPVEDIAAGVNNAMASRMAILANNIGVERDVCMTGGVAKNDGVVSALEKLLGVRIKRDHGRADPQLAGRHRRGALRAGKSERRYAMIAAGCDVGSLTAKAVIMKDGKDRRVGGDPGEDRSPEESAREVMDLALKRRASPWTDIAYCVGTGYGRKHIPFVNDVESEIACHGRGAVWQVPSARTVVDIGGQDCKAIKVDANGNVKRYVYNDKCASGTGRFLEIIAEALEIKLEDLGDIAAKSTKKLTLSNQCVVFAETEIISLVNEGAEIADIINALHQAVANRAASLAKSIMRRDGCRDDGRRGQELRHVRRPGEALGVTLHSVEDPQINGALGAALFAQERAGA